jgi:hypothetical protein
MKGCFGCIVGGGLGVRGTGIITGLRRAARGVASDCNNGMNGEWPRWVNERTLSRSGFLVVCKRISLQINELGECIPWAVPLVQARYQKGCRVEGRKCISLCHSS